MVTVRRIDCPASTTSTTRSPSEGTEPRGAARLPAPGRADRRLLPGDRGDRGARGRARGGGALGARGASSWPRATGSSSACTSCTGSSPPSATSSPSAREAILGLEGLDAGSRALPARHRRPPGPGRGRVPAPDRGPDRAHPDVLQRELRPPQRRRRAADRSVGTIFVIWTVVTGFFGQNFGWLVNHIDSRHGLPRLRRRRAGRPHGDHAHTVLGQATRLVLNARG